MRPHKSQPLRVLLVSSGFFPSSVGGGEVQVLSLARALAARGHLPVVLDFHDSPKRALLRASYEGISVVHLHGPAERSWYSRPSWLVDWAKEWLVAERIDLVHVFLWVHLMGIVSAARILGLQVVLTALEFGYFCRRFDLLRQGKDLCELGSRGPACEDCVLSQSSAKQAALARAMRLLPSGTEMILRNTVHTVVGEDLLVSLGARTITAQIERQRAAFKDEIAAVIAPSAVMRDFYLAQRVDPQKIRMIPYGMEPQKLQQRVSPRQTGRLKAAFIGRLHPTKGLHVLISAIQRLAADVEVTLDIWAPENSGPPDYLATIQKAAAAHERRVRWKGFLPRDQLAAVYSEIDALVVPSVWYENSPVTVGEALACGCPVVCSDTKGMADWIRNGVNGLTFPIGDAPALASCLDRLAREEGLLEHLRIGISPPKTADSVADETIVLYRQVLAEAGRRTRESRSVA